MKDPQDIESIRRSICEHVAYRHNSDIVNAVWAGYLAALLVEGLISSEVYHDLNRTLKNVGREEQRELLIGYPGQFGANS